MGTCRNKSWLIVLSIFSIWSVLVCFNYSSLIDSVATLASSYVNNVNYQEPLISIPIKISHNTTTQDETNTKLTNSDLKIDKKIEDLIGEDAIDNLLNVNNLDDDFAQKNEPIFRGKLHDPTLINSTQSQSVSETIIFEDGPKDIPQEIPQKNLLGMKRRQVRPPKRKTQGKNMSIIKQTQKQQRVDANVGEIKTDTTPSPPPPPPPPSPPPPSPPPPRKCMVKKKVDRKTCMNRYIYVHTLPRRFNVDLLRDCRSLDPWMDMCNYVKNSGLGPELQIGRVFSEHGWFATNQFLLEVIFHNRMKQYDCLTNDSSLASAIFVPFYAGLDVARHLWNKEPAKVRDSGGIELAKLLKRKAEWRRWWGRDHFFVGGRITWDFRRSENTNGPDWGTKFLRLPESKNMTGLIVESSPWNNNDFGIPYPTNFHPANDEEVLKWQNRMRRQKRRNLFSFVGGPRPDRPNSIRNQVISQCDTSRKCLMVYCNDWRDNCHNPTELMRVFQSSVFCLQLPGESYTERSIFDSILAGCIPVFFHPGSAYIQYLWHLPREFTKYSVFIPLYDLRDGEVIETTLEMISSRKVAEMREEIINLIPRIVYADPRCRLETFKDAFDVAIRGVLERVRRIKKDMKQGRNDSFGYDEGQAWKYRWVGTSEEEHEWDPYFSGAFDSWNSA